MQVKDQFHASAALLPRRNVVMRIKVFVPAANQTPAFQVVATRFTDFHTGLHIPEMFSYRRHTRTTYFTAFVHSVSTQ